MRLPYFISRQQYEGPPPCRRNSLRQGLLPLLEKSVTHVPKRFIISYIRVYLCLPLHDCLAI